MYAHDKTAAAKGFIAQPTIVAVCNKNPVHLFFKFDTAKISRLCIFYK